MTVQQLTNSIGPKSWEYRVAEYQRENSTFKSRTCSIFDTSSKWPAEPNRLCPCDRMIRCHSFDGRSMHSKSEPQSNSEWNPPDEFLHNRTHSTSVPVNVYGTLPSSGCKFIRLDNRVSISHVFNLILDDCGKQRPSLILSVYGGAKYFTITERLEKEFIRGVIEAATMADAWVITAGISNGVSKLVGEGIANNRLLKEYSKTVKCIGMTMWGTIDESTRTELKNMSKSYPEGCRERQIPDHIQDDEESIEPNHAYCVLFDSGKLNEYLSDSQRNCFVSEACKSSNSGETCHAVTLIVEGGEGSLEVIENDLKAARPIVFIQGSGRLADVLASLIEQTSNFDSNRHWDPSAQEIQQALEHFYPNFPQNELNLLINRIKKIFANTNRHLMHVFSLDRDKNVTEIIFKAIFTAISFKNRAVGDIPKPGSSNTEEQKRAEEDKLVDLALKWDYFDGVASILQARQEQMIKKRGAELQSYIERQKHIFLTSLEYNRPRFIKYFLNSGFDPLTLVDKNDVFGRRTIINLYKKSSMNMNWEHKHTLEKLFGSIEFGSIEQLNFKVNKLVGSFCEPIYPTNHDTIVNRIKIDACNYLCCCYPRVSNDEYFVHSETAHHQTKNETIGEKYTKNHILRDLFLWSIFMDLPDMAKVLLLHIRARICAALFASALFKRYANSSLAVDLKQKFRLQSLEFESYAASCINKCYEYNNQYACELLLRQNPLFGNATCMQVAISSESGKLLETACFDQALQHVWYNKLSDENHLISAKFLQIFSILSFGLLGPVLLKYRDGDKELVDDDVLSSTGINYYINKQYSTTGKWKKYWRRFKYFHDSPMIKMSYHFLSYVWFLLVFSYMVLYRLDGRNEFTVPHWTEIYVIITVSTMFCEEARRIYHEYKTRMTERWGSSGSALLTALSNMFYILPYFLFFLGLGFRYESYSSSLLSTARIIWALDLELWYLRSLKFVIALKFLGPKLFMLKNMLRDLFAFMYMIFIAIAAYGVVSRALIFYNQVPFTGKGIFTSIFYEPYWFIYGEVSDKNVLDETINNGSGIGDAEATATHVLLAFHMLFINILLLNLLVAVFADSIGKVQQNTEFYWRYQRYSFVREYFEHLPLSYPPLIFFSHLALLIMTIQNKCCPKLCRSKVADENHATLSKTIKNIFKMISMSKGQYEKWDSFESAATHSYARRVLEKEKYDEISVNDDDKFSTTIGRFGRNVNKSTGDQQAIEDIRTELITTVKLAIAESQKGLEQNNSRMENRLDQMSISVSWVMDAIERVKMNDPKYPKPNFEQSSVQSEITPTALH